MDSIVKIIEVLKKFANNTKMDQTVSKEQDRVRLQQAIDNPTSLADQVLKEFADDTKMGQTVCNDEDRAKLQQAADNPAILADK